MGMLDGILGGLVGAGLTTMASKMLEKHGGVQGLVAQFEKEGMGDTIKSWISEGANDAISPEQIHKVLGSDTVKKWADTFGISTDDMADKLSEMLPELVDKMTPQGKIAA